MNKFLRILILYLKFSYTAFPGETQLAVEDTNNEQTVEMSTVETSFKNNEKAKKSREDLSFEQRDECSICLETIDLEQGIIVCENGNHNIHRQCAIAMLARKIDRCPICRRGIVTNIRNNFIPEENQQLTVSSRIRSYSSLRTRELIMRHPKLIIGLGCLAISWYSFFLFHLMGIHQNHNNDDSDD